MGIEIVLLQSRGTQKIIQKKSYVYMKEYARYRSRIAVAGVEYFKTMLTRL